jgi:hypothetical protein
VSPYCSDFITLPYFHYFVEPFKSNPHEASPKFAESIKESNIIKTRPAFQLKCCTLNERYEMWKNMLNKYYFYFRKT